MAARQLLGAAGRGLDGEPLRLMVTPTLALRGWWKTTPAGRLGCGVGAPGCHARGALLRVVSLLPAPVCGRELSAEDTAGTTRREQMRG